MIFPCYSQPWCVPHIFRSLLSVLQIEVSDEDINFLRQRLQSARLPPALHEEANMTYGYPSSGLDTLRQSMLQFDMRKWAAEVSNFFSYN